SPADRALPWGRATRKGLRSGKRQGTKRGPSEIERATKRELSNVLGTWHHRPTGWHPRTKSIRGKANHAQAPAHRRAGVPVATHAIGRSGERSVRPGITRRRPRRHP